MKFEHTVIFNFEGAFRGMRNPLNSWGKSDSDWEENKIGKNDMDLAIKLVNAGSEHRKFLRQIIVSVDITAPQYWFSQFDTYKIGTTANSTSKMHKMLTKEFSLDDFETSSPFLEKDSLMESIIKALNLLRAQYMDNDDSVNKKMIWREILCILPMSYLQTRTITMSYENVRNIYHQRKDHKLNEWSGCDFAQRASFVKWVEALPYSKELIIGGKEEC